LLAQPLAQSAGPEQHPELEKRRIPLSAVDGQTGKLSALDGKLVFFNNRKRTDAFAEFVFKMKSVVAITARRADSGQQDKEPWPQSRWGFMVSLAAGTVIRPQLCKKSVSFKGGQSTTEIGHNLTGLAGRLLSSVCSAISAVKTRVSMQRLEI